MEELCVEPAVTRRLQALGLNDGTVIDILNRKKRGALIVRVRGTRLALGKHISSSITVSEQNMAENHCRMEAPHFIESHCSVESPHSTENSHSAEGGPGNQAADSKGKEMG